MRRTKELRKRKTEEKEEWNLGEGRIKVRHQEDPTLKIISEMESLAIFKYIFSHTSLEEKEWRKTEAKQRPSI